MATADKTDATPALVTARASRVRSPQLSQSASRLIGRIVTYTLLTIGAIIMLFPILWMFTASLKPEWQILAQPPIWIPSEWIHVQAGDTAQELPLYAVVDSATGERQEVIRIGSRRYTTALEITRLTEVLSVPADELSATTATDVDGVIFNVRQWQAGDGSTIEVVALARDGDNLIVAPVETLRPISSELPLAVVNAGSRAEYEINGITFRGRELDDGRIVVPLGPESELTVVAPDDGAIDARLVAADMIEQDGFAPVGNTEVQQYRIIDGPEDEHYVLLTSEAWQPVMDLETLKENAFVVPNSELSGDDSVMFSDDILLPVRTLERDGETQSVVVLLARSAQSLVIPREQADSLRLVRTAKLALPFVHTMDGFAVRYKDNFVQGGERKDVAIVGERRNMALITPLEHIARAFDVEPAALSPVLVPRLHFENYIDALSRDLGGATFFTFFLNSAIVVILNLLGHFLSVTVVAYGFARLRAPGKDFLFMLLLATMMLPFPVMLIPTFEIFQRLNMINTLWPLFIRSFFGNAFLIFLLRQFYTTIPVEMEEAARIDGASTAQVLWHVMLPLSKPALATIGIFTFWWSWNSFFEPFVYISSVKNFTVSLGLAFFQGQYTTSYHLLMSASMVAILPIIVIFFFAQRYFIEGIQLSGLKG